MSTLSNHFTLFITFGNIADRSNGGAVYTSGIARTLSQGSIFFQALDYYTHAPLSGRAARKVAALLQMLLLRRPMPVGYFFSRRLVRAALHGIESLLSSQDVHVRVFIDHMELMYLAPIIRKKFGDRVTLIHISHNLESRLFLSRLSSQWMANFFEAWAAYTDFERSMLSLCNGIITISEDESKVYRALLGEDFPVRVVPPLFDYVPAQTPPVTCARKMKLVFLANMDWWPNAEAAKWLLEELAPVLDECFELHLYGKGSDKLVPVGGRVFLHGFVQDIQQVWHDCFVSLAPLVHGGGVNIKVAESLYNGVPLVCTALSLRGLPDHFTGGSIAVERNPDAWANTLHRLALDHVAYQHLRGSCNYPQRKEVQALLDFER